LALLYSNLGGLRHDVLLCRDTLRQPLMIALPTLQLRGGKSQTLGPLQLFFLSLSFSLECFEPCGFLLVQKLYLTQGMFTLFFMLASVTEHPLQPKLPHRPLLTI